MRHLVLLAALAAGPAHAAQTVTHTFCWQGANGYSVEGYIAYPETARGIVTEAQVTGFGITGFKDGAVIGQWSLKDRKPGTSLTIRFDADRLEFPMGGIAALNSYQEWNANGFVDDCGTPGFGFNGGNWAQDVCIDGVWVEESGIAPDTPLPISADPTNPCAPLQLSGDAGAPRTGGRPA